MNNALYGEEFYRERHSRTEYAAGAVLGPLIETLGVRSVVDFGCGVGTWLRAARELGADRYVGYDGEWVPEDRVEDIELRRVDLGKRIKLEEKFDLSISLEVAEHLPPDCAGLFVDNITSVSDFCLFGAAVPGQGGVGHINEQWQEYWVNLFIERDFQPLDVIRPRIWNDPKIDWWYRQNTFLFVPSSSVARIRERLCPEGRSIDWPINLVHPSCLEDRIARLSRPKPLLIRDKARIAARLPLDLMAKLIR